jgi:transcriptional regulator with XRE-family HTH domain
MPKPRKPRQRANAALDQRIGGLIRHRRLELGLSQSALAAKLNLTFQQVQKYENGTNQLSIGRLLQISDALRAPLRYFLSGDDAPVRYEAVDLKLTRAMAGIRNRSVKGALLRLVRTLI